MTELSPAVRALLAEAGAQHDPSPRELDRGLDALHATLAFSAPLLAASAVSASAASSVAPAAATVAKATALQTAASAFSGGALVGAKAVKLYLITAAVIGSVGTVAVFRSAPAPIAKREASVQTTPAVREPDVRMVLPKVVEQVEPVVAPQPVVAPAARAARTVDIGAELSLIEAAQQSLQRTQPGRALSQLEQHARSYPRGLLASEREGLRAIALCEAGRGAEGRRAKDAFLARAGSTPIAERVRKACP
ncbi:MAG: hypothetical protein ABW352_22335 [Polyangiales bacterium]